jgi:hypothetical protein
VIGGPPQVVCDAVDLYENLIEMPVPASTAGLGKLHAVSEGWFNGW